jgi:hypothetical protein
VIFQNNHWQLLNDQSPLQLTWTLVKKDFYGNPISMKYLGEGSSINFRIIDNPRNYQLYLYVNNGKEIQIIQSKLSPNL